MQNVKILLEQRQTAIYFLSVVAAALVALALPATEKWDQAINPALALMLFATFLQVPLASLKRNLTQIRFLAALLTVNFIVIPLSLAILAPYLPADPMVRLGILLVLLAPCIDYVVTFSHLGRADAARLLAATPVLLMVQMLALPFYLGLFLGRGASELIRIAPFFHAFIWLIAVPLLLAWLVQWGARRSPPLARLADGLGFLPVPATALVLFVVVVSVIPQLKTAWATVLAAIPFYILFAVIAPVAGWLVGRLFQLESAGGRAVAFSAGTRNSLVVLPLALAIPGAIPTLPAIIVTQTLVELLSELIYIRIIPKLSARTPRT
ncbi:arsenic resistance protein [Brenneria populi subsp. brevivirga]|uniref:arsenic resistance protein n=1 Tax=Brenneria populi TaxID=1505588 RepID=UPI002E19E247|nr:arsenic resistance protein [Brenneria populi subsp. brevivirga]